MTEFFASGIRYTLPLEPVVVVCIDGGDADYIQSGWQRSRLPTFRRFAVNGFYGLARGTMPSFTCPNNMSIATGVPASVHGISGNFFLDTDTWQAVPMTGPELLRAETIFCACASAGGRVACVTAKDKLRLQLQKGLDMTSGRHVSLSIEKLTDCTMADNGISNVLEQVGLEPADIYSASLSLHVLEVGLFLLKQNRFDLVYLSLSDYIQHTYAPDEPQAGAFYDALDDMLARLDASGARIGLCADHGMSDKSTDDGQPRVIFIQDLLDQKFGAATSQVICPITDAFVRHHGALGGFIRIWIKQGGPPPEAIIQFLKTVVGVELALTREQACDMFELPEDREADVIVIASKNYALGAASHNHDLSALSGIRLRSHGGLSEALIPVLFNRPLSPDTLRKIERSGLNSHQMFELVINGVNS